MTCPACNGDGYVTKRFLWIFTRAAFCVKCRGTGKFPPGPIQRIPDTRVDDSYYQDHDRVVSAPVSPDSRERSDPFSVGDGGRSGGAGGGAAWDDRGGPVIADPFAAGESPGASSMANSDSAPDDSASASDSSESSEGTSY